MSAYIEALPADRPTHMLGRPIERLVTHDGDLGDFMPNDILAMSGYSHGVSMNDLYLADEDRGVSLYARVGTGLGCPRIGGYDGMDGGYDGMDGLSGGAARKNGAALAAAIRELARAERVLVEADVVVLERAAKVIEKCRKQRSKNKGKLAAGKSAVESGLSGSHGAKLVASLNKIVALDRALEATERDVVKRAAAKLLSLRDRLAEVRATLKVCKAKGPAAAKLVEHERLAASLKACKENWREHMKNSHGTEVGA